MAETVRVEVARRRIRQQQLADALGISQAAVSRRLRGLSPFAVDELVTVARLLGLPAADLLPVEPLSAGVA